MAYASGNSKTKKALRELIANGKAPHAFQPGGIFPDPDDGETVIEGPHYPEPHRWYARVLVQGGVIVKVIS